MPRFCARCSSRCASPPLRRTVYFVGSSSRASTCSAAVVFGSAAKYLASTPSTIRASSFELDTPREEARCVKRACCRAGIEANNRAERPTVDLLYVITAASRCCILLALAYPALHTLATILFGMPNTSTPSSPSQRLCSACRTILPSTPSQRFCSARRTRNGVTFSRDADPGLPVRHAELRRVDCVELLRAVPVFGLHNRRDREHARQEHEHSGDCSACQTRNTGTSSRNASLGLIVRHAEQCRVTRAELLRAVAVFGQQKSVASAYGRQESSVSVNVRHAEHDRRARSFSRGSPPSSVAQAVW